MQATMPQYSEKLFAMTPHGPTRVREVTSDLAYLCDRIVNVFFHGPRDAGDRGWVLVDAGLPGSAGRIADAAAERFGAYARPRCIVLTHGHFDHVGGLLELADRWDVPIYAHAMETPFLTGRSSYPPPDPTVGGGLMSLLSRFYPRGPVNVAHRLHTLPGDFSVPGMHGWRWIYTPGHTAGHVSLFRDTDQLLIAGDAVVTTRQESLWSVLTQAPRISRPPAYYTSDWEAARNSVEKLALLDPSTIVTGHGPPMWGEPMRQQLRDLVYDFEKQIPRGGRYAHTPAIIDQRGVVSLPPPVGNGRTIALASVALAGAAIGAWALWRRTHRRAA